MAFLVDTAVSNKLRALGLNQEFSFYKTSSTLLNIVPFLSAIGFAVLLWGFPNSTVRLSIIMLYSFIFDGPHLYATYAYMKENHILKKGNPHFWGSLVLFCLPLLLFFWQIPFIQDNSIKAQFLLFQLLLFLAANFHRARQHWGILKKESQSPVAFPRYIERIEQSLILSILFLPYTYAFLKNYQFLSSAPLFSIGLNEKLIAIEFLLVIWVCIEVFLLCIEKYKPLYEQIGFIKKITTVVRRSFASICMLWLPYAFFASTFGLFLFLSNALCIILMLILLIKEYKFNNRLFFIFKLLFFQFLVAYLAGDSIFAYFTIYMVNSCLHSVQYLLFVTQQEARQKYQRKSEFLKKNLMSFFIFSTLLCGLLYLIHIAQLELVKYTLALMFSIFSMHHLYLDSIIWRKDAAKNLAMAN